MGRPMRAQLTAINLAPEPRPVPPSREEQAWARAAQGLAIVTDALRQLIEARRDAPPPIPADCPLLLPREAAQRLGRSPSTVYRWMAEGAIPTRVVGETKYVDWHAFTERKEAKD